MLVYGDAWKSDPDPFPSVTIDQHWLLPLALGVVIPLAYICIHENSVLPWKSRLEKLTFSVRIVLFTDKSLWLSRLKNAPYRQLYFHFHFVNHQRKWHYCYEQKLIVVYRAAFELYDLINCGSNSLIRCVLTELVITSFLTNMKLLWETYLSNTNIWFIVEFYRLSVVIIFWSSICLRNNFWDQKEWNRSTIIFSLVNK